MRVPPNNLIPQNLLASDGIIFEAAKRFSTPLFVYSAEQLKNEWDQLRKAMPSHVEILYSLKANPTLAMVGLFARLGAGFEVSSIGEIMAVERVGGDLSRAVFCGPGKGDAEIGYALEAGVGFLAVESQRELLALEREAQARSTCVKALLRVNPSLGFGDPRMSGATQFGMDPATALDTLAIAGKLQYVSVVGVHGFMGTRLLEWPKLASNFEAVVDMAATLAVQSEGGLPVIDFGGGFGVPSYAGEEELDVAALGEVLGDMIAAHRQKNPAASRYFVESGRRLAARAGVLVTTVVDVKKTAGSVFVIVDCGINALGGRDALLGSKAAPVRFLSEAPGGEEELTICGPLCTPADRLAAKVRLPMPRPGDLALFYNAGAYCLTASPGLLLSRGFPAEAMICGGELLLIRKAAAPEDIFAGQCGLEGLDAQFCAASVCAAGGN